MGISCGSQSTRSRHLAVLPLVFSEVRVRVRGLLGFKNV